MRGLCGVCQASQAAHTCELCGEVVCDQHYHGQSGACTLCADPTADDPAGFRI
ncbi:MAG: hypothetical protein A07HR60_01373 [uncultured archaeon A07HR60]|jgi:hypothetical protein|nr:MAG: hypothetical protein A07HR60_01373 [uncultured archaeon A07HR60]